MTVSRPLVTSVQGMKEVRILRRRTGSGAVLSSSGRHVSNMGLAPTQSAMEAKMLMITIGIWVRIGTVAMRMSTKMLWAPWRV